MSNKQQYKDYIRNLKQRNKNLCLEIKKLNKEYLDLVRNCKESHQTDIGKAHSENQLHNVIAIIIGAIIGAVGCLIYLVARK